MSGADARETLSSYEGQYLREIQVKPILEYKDIFYSYSMGVYV